MCHSADEDRSRRAFFQAHHPELRRMLYARIPDRGAADELANTIWMMMFSKWPASDVRSPSGLLFTIAWRQTANWFRARDIRCEATGAEQLEQLVAETARQQRLPDAVPHDSADTLLLQDEHLVTAVRQLPGRCREALFWRHLVGLRGEPVAQQMNISVTAVNKLLAKARSELASSPLLQHYRPRRNRVEAKS